MKIQGIMKTTPQRIALYVLIFIILLVVGIAVAIWLGLGPTIHSRKLQFSKSSSLRRQSRVVRSARTTAAEISNESRSVYRSLRQYRPPYRRHTA